MPTDKLIPLPSLQVDTDNARLAELAPAKQQGRYIINLRVHSEPR